MNVDPSQPPIVLSVTVSNRPRWSVMIPVYNCATYLPRTLQSVLQQDLGEAQMQIEVVDDASTDADVKAMVEEIGKGRVRYFRQAQNVGSLKNFETCLNRAEGELIHLLHGDDKVRNGYYQKMEALFQQCPEIGAAFCRYTYINEADDELEQPPIEAPEDGVLKAWLLRIAQHQRLQYCVMTVKRDVYEKLGGFYGVRYGEDWEMWVRIAAHYPVAYTPEILAEYRRHENSITGQAFLNGQNLRDVQWVINTIQNYLPADQRKKAKQEALKYYAHYAASTANTLWQTTRNKQGALAQMQEALHMHGDLKLFWRLAKLRTRMLLKIR